MSRRPGSEHDRREQQRAQLQQARVERDHAAEQTYDTTLTHGLIDAAAGRALSLCGPVKGPAVDHDPAGRVVSGVEVSATF